MTDLTIEGVTQPIAEWALDYGIPADLIELRLQAGWTPKDAVETEMPITTRALAQHRRHLRDGSPAKRYQANGRNLTLREWSYKLGISEKTLRSRLSARWPYERVFTSRRYNDWHGHGA